MASAKQTYNRTIIDIWNRAPKRSLYLPLQLEEPPFGRGAKGRVVLLGCNPSLPRGRTTKSKRGKGVIWQNSRELKVLADLQQKDVYGGSNQIKPHAYFVPILELLARNEIDTSEFDWMDLYAVRNTTQSQLAKHFHEFQDFYVAQEDAALKLLAVLEPKLVLVANAFVAGRLRDRNLVSEPHETFCYFERLKLEPDVENLIPALFSRPFSGTGRMDKGTLSLYEWNLRRVIRHLERSKSK